MTAAALALQSSGQHALSADALDPHWLEAACLGARLPEAAELHLRLAGVSYAHDALAEQHLRKAREAAPDHPAVLIGFYRFYFYKGRLAEALDIARECLCRAAQVNGLAADWRLAKREQANFSSYDAILPRFFLFTLKAYGYLHMRLGNLNEGHLALTKMLELDPSDKLNATVLIRVLTRHGREDDDDAE